jgi:hypothetical protein
MAMSTDAPEVGAHRFPLMSMRPISERSEEPITTIAAPWRSATAWRPAAGDLSEMSSVRWFRKRRLSA